MKKILIILISLFLILNLTGCSESPLKTYKKATEKSSALTMGKRSYEIFIENEYVTEGLTQEEIKKLNYFNSIETKVNISFDDEENKFISRNYSNFGGMGFDSVLYSDGEKVFLKMPVVGKYLIFSGMDELNKDEKYTKMPISEESIKEIKDKWISMLNKKDVTSGNKTLLDTENGQVKATLFTINLKEEMIKEFIGEAIKIVMTDKVFINYVKNELEIDYFKLIEDMGEMSKKLEDLKIDRIKYEAYIDIDGYIIKSTTNVDVSYSNLELGNLKGQKMSIETNLWDIGKKQKFEFPTLNEDNILDMENMDEGIPFIFEDMFNKGK